MSCLPSILLAEDDENDVFFLQRAFKTADLRNPLHVARDGQEAIEYLAGEGTYSDRVKCPVPCLLILDLKMPRKTGMDVLEWKRQHPILHYIPVIVLSSSAHRYDIERAYRLGANAFIVKPPSVETRVNLACVIKSFWLEFNNPPLACTEGIEEAMKHHAAVEIPRNFF
jgi:CheY-like chemotaxis protein